MKEKICTALVICGVIVVSAGVTYKASMALRKDREVEGLAFKTAVEETVTTDYERMHKRD